jgi:tetratricopeptide (TPR) repeat protein
LRRGTAVPDAPPFVHEALAQLCVGQGLVDEGLAAARRAAAAGARRAGLWLSLARLLIVADRLDEARDALERALALEPRSIEALNNLGTVLQRLDRPDLAAARYRDALALDPDNAEVLSNLAAALAKLGEYDEGLALARRAIALKPAFPNPYVHAALIEIDRSRFRAALGWIDAAPAGTQDEATILVMRANILRELHRSEEGIAVCRRAIALQPGSSDAHKAEGLLLRELGRDHEALAAFDRAFSLAPTQGMPLALKADLMMELGRRHEAAALADLASAIEPSSAIIWYTRALTRQFAVEPPELAAMEALLAKVPAPPYVERLHLHFAMGGAYLEASDAERAFRHLHEGNRLKRGLLSYDVAADERRMAAIADAFPPALMAAAPEGGLADDRMIFIVGMPRSGTTLVEQILASHPRIHGAGELHHLDAAIERAAAAKGRDSLGLMADLEPEDLRGIARDYLARVGELPARKARIVDKMVTNSLYAGIIRLALPRARIIHCRRNPVDTCLSCYSKLFAAGQEFSYDLAELGRYHRAHDRLMAHWRRVLPAQCLLEVDYEDVVGDLETAARRLIAFCGLRWSSRCLRFHETKRPVRTSSMLQVRKPLYRTSVDRRRHFAEHLAPLIQAFDERSAASPRG